MAKKKLKVDPKDPKHLGIPNIQFSLTNDDDKREEKYVKQRIERGFDDSETWSLRDTFAKFIIPRLKRFKELNNGYPPEMTAEEWNSRLDKMIAAFEYVGKADEITPTQEEHESFKEGINLFTEYYFDLWW